jgi:ubiquinol-cytochrome c reductase cytochrome c1 subunit
MNDNHHDHKNCCHEKQDCTNKNWMLMALAVLFGLVIAGVFFAAIFLADTHTKVAKGEVAKYAKHAKQIIWPFDGIQGSFDRQSAQRGFQVYKEVCSACHGLKRVAFRNLTDLGFSEAEVKALAKDYTYKTIADDGSEAERPGLPSDHFPSAFANEQAARAANNGAYPPDMSLLVKARHDGANYIYSLITGYEEAPADFPLGAGMNYNPYFEGRQIAMAAPLSDDAVTYADGTKASLDQMARDVVTFLQWAAEPETEHRKSMGLRVMIFLGLGTIFFWIAKKRVWKNIH